ncbi:MAG: hypothetical protein ACWGMZ_01560 [Thermoguttaceae bacterium]
MRWLSLAFVPCLFVLLLTNGSNSFAAGCINCGGNDAASYRAYSGGACFAPPGFCTAPGCCQCPPSACDNAWAGYCQHKARWQAYFYNVGVPKARCGGCCMTPVAAPCHCYEEEISEPIDMQSQPTPAVKQPASPKPAPAPTPTNKSAWRFYSPVWHW